MCMAMTLIQALQDFRDAVRKHLDGAGAAGVRDELYDLADRVAAGQDLSRRLDHGALTLVYRGVVDDLLSARAAA